MGEALTRDHRAGIHAGRWTSGTTGRIVVTHVRGIRRIAS